MTGEFEDRPPTDPAARAHARARADPHPSAEVHAPADPQAVDRQAVDPQAVGETDLPHWLWELADALPDLVAVFSGNGSLQYLNPAGHRRLGFDPAEPVTLRMTDLFAREELENIVGSAIPNAIHDRSWTGRTAIVARNDIIPVLLTIKVHRDTDSGELRAMSFIARDLSRLDDELVERRASEDSFRAIAAYAPDIIAVTDPQGRFDYVSPSAERIIGHTPEELKKMDGWLILHPDDQPTARGLMEMALQDPGMPVRGVLRIRHKDGDWRHLEMHLVTRNDDLETPKLLSYWRDVTQRTELEARLRSQMDALMAAQEERMRFLDTIAHDMNQPLSPIVLQVHLLRHLSASDDVRTRKALHIIEENAVRLERFLGDFRDASRADTGELSMEPERFDLATRVASVTASHAAAAERLGVRLDRICFGSFPVDADPGRIDQVLFNLIRNALKFTPPGGHISVRLDQVGDHARCTVTDTGRGLAEDELEVVFQPFVQVHGPDETGEKGTGLGLAISRGIIEQHGGVLRAESDGLGHGARFVFTLPMADDEG